MQYHHPLRHANPPQGVKNVNYIFGISEGGVHAPCCRESGGELKKAKWWCTRCFTFFALRGELTWSCHPSSSSVPPPTPSKKGKHCIRLPAPRFYFLAPPPHEATMHAIYQDLLPMPPIPCTHPPGHCPRSWERLPLQRLKFQKK